MNPFFGKVVATVIAFQLAGCVRAVDQDGWTCSGSSHAMTCRPENGEWLGFRIGMSRDEALQAGCAARLSGKVADSREFSLVRGRCVPSEEAADGSKPWSDAVWWFEPVLQPSQRHCAGTNVEALRVKFVEEKISDISTDCTLTLP